MALVAQFEITYTQFLDENGEVTKELPEFANDKQTLIDLYQTMVQTRAYDTKAIALQRTGKMGTYARKNLARIFRRILKLYAHILPKYRP